MTTTSEFQDETEKEELVSNVERNAFVGHVIKSGYLLSCREHAIALHFWKASHRWHTCGKRWGFTESRLRFIRPKPLF